MESVWLYFLKVNILMFAFLGVYHLFLKKETFFKGNRWYLLSGLFVSLILPFITFTKTIWIDPIPLDFTHVSPNVSSNIQPIVEEQNSFTWESFLLLGYLVIASVFLVKLMIEMISFFKRIKKQQKEKQPHYTLVKNDSSEGPFSFLHYIVVNPQQFSEEELEQILLHEQVHVKQKHSIDIIISKIFCSIIWFNPFIKLYHQAITQNLEYLADKEVNRITNNKQVYLKTLLKVVSHSNQLTTANLFYQSFIKKRIVMLNTNPSSKLNAWKYSLVLPTIIAFTMLFQVETIAQVKKAQYFTSATKFSSILTKDASDKDIKELEAAFQDGDYKLKISNVKRNALREIIAVKLVFRKSENDFKVFERSTDQPIKNIRIFKSSNDQEENCGFEEGDQSTLNTVKFESLFSNDNDIAKLVLDSITSSGKKVKVIVNGKEIEEGATFSSNDELDEMVNKAIEEAKKKLEGKVNGKDLQMDVKTYKLPAKVVTTDSEKIVFNSKDGTVTINGKVMKLDELNGLNNEVLSKVSVFTSEDFKLEGLDEKILEIIKNETKNLPVKEVIIENLSARNSKDKLGFTIHKLSKNEEIEQYKANLTSNNITAKISGIKRNSLGEITSIQIQLKQGDTKIQKNIQTDYPIQSIFIGRKNGKIVIEENS